jgi:hypothetical protein
VNSSMKWTLLSLNSDPSRSRSPSRSINHGFSAASPRGRCCECCILTNKLPTFGQSDNFGISSFQHDLLMHGAGRVSDRKCRDAQSRLVNSRERVKYTYAAREQSRIMSTQSRPTLGLSFPYMRHCLENTHCPGAF